MNDYEIYRKIASKEEYFESWDPENYARLDEEMEEQIYDKYVIKAKVFQRDSFACQNIDCEWDSPLTLHHIKWQKNGGKHSTRNCVSLCRACHQSYHRAKRGFTLPDEEYVPSHIRGHYFEMSKSDIINWRKVQKEMKAFRKTIKSERNYLKWEEISLLLEWLERPYTLYDD